MKNILLLLFTFIYLTGIGQNIHYPATTQLPGFVPAPNTVSGRFLGDNLQYNAITAVIPTVGLGTLFSQSTFPNTSNFTTSGTFTFGASGGELNFSGGTPFQISNVIGNNNTATQVANITAYGGTMLERYSILMGFKVKASPGATTYGTGIGTFSTNNGGHSLSNCFAYFNLSTSAGQGRVYIVAGQQNTTVAVSPDSIIVNNGDSIVVTFERKLDKFYASARDVTTNSTTVLCDYQFDVTNSAGVLAPNTGLFGIYHFGGTYSVDTIIVSSIERKFPNIMTFGDSKMRYAMGWDVSVSAQINRWLTNTINCSGEGDATADMLLHVPEVIAIHPSTVLLEAGRNDLGYGVSTGVWQANIDTIVVRLQRAGITVWLLDAMYETFISQTSLVSFIQSTFPTQYIGTFAAGQGIGAAAVCSDQVHPTFLGAQIVATALIDRMVIANNAKYVDGINDGTRIYGISFQNVNSYGYWRDLNATYQIPPGLGDFSLRDGASIAAAYPLNQVSRIKFATTGTGRMDFSNSTGSTLQTGGGFNWNTPRGAASGEGNLALSMRLTNTGVLEMGNSVAEGPNAAPGDFYIQWKNRLASYSTTGAGNGGEIQLYDVNGNTDLYNYHVGGRIIFNTSFGTPGGATGGVQITSNGFLSCNPQTIYEIARVQGESTTLPQLGAFYDATHYATFQTNSSGNLTIAPTGAFVSVSGNLLAGTSTNNAGFIQTAANTATNASMFLNGAAVDVTSPTNGMLRYITTGTHHLYFRDGGADVDLLLAGGGSTPTLQQVLTAGSTLTANNTITNTAHVLTESGGILNTTGGFYNSAQGSEFLGSASTINNAVTAASGTVSNFSAYAFLAPTITSTNASITYTTPATVRIDNSPTLSTNSTASVAYALDVAAGQTHMGVGGSNVSIITDGGAYLNGASITNTNGVALGASTTTQAALNFNTGVDPTGSVLTHPGNSWFNGTNYYFVNASGAKIDLLKGIKNYEHNISTPSTGGTVNLVTGQYNIINPSGALATLTVNLPSSPLNNDVVYIKYTQTITAVTYGNGTVVDGITAPSAGGLVVLTFDTGTTSWY